MKLSIASIASGSSGNCYLVKSETTALLVDAGISGKQIFSALEEYGETKLPAAVLITHEHSDHIKGLPAVIKKNITVMGNKETLSCLQCKDIESKSQTIEKEKFYIGDICISPFSLSHDAVNPFGYSFSKDGACISIITDTGCLTDESKSYMRKSDILVLESNHDVNMLRIGRYPYFLKERILSKKGHLSNETAAEAVAAILKEDILTGREGKRTVLLAHLSRENNFPQMAMATMSNILEREGFIIGKDVLVETLSQFEKSILYTLR